MKWELLQSNYLYRDTWFTLRADTCRRADGHIISPYYVYEFPTWVAAVALTEEGQVVMVKQYRHALGEVCIELPGGCVDDADSSHESAIARELLEETGYSFGTYQYLGAISCNPSTHNNLLHMYLATGGRPTATQSLDANEEIEIVQYSIPEVKQLIRDGKIIQSMHISCLLYALSELGELSY